MRTDTVRESGLFFPGQLLKATRLGWHRSFHNMYKLGRRSYTLRSCSDTTRSVRPEQRESAESGAFLHSTRQPWAPIRDVGSCTDVPYQGPVILPYDMVWTQSVLPHASPSKHSTPNHSSKTVHPVPQSGFSEDRLPGNSSSQLFITKAVTG